MSVKFQWVKSPDDLARGVGRFGKEARDRIARVAGLTGMEAAGEMKARRPWRDVTGNAKRGLRAEVEADDDRVALYFIHSVEYGADLELGHAGRYAIVLPIMEETAPKLQRRLTNVL